MRRLLFSVLVLLALPAPAVATVQYSASATDIRDRVPAGGKATATFSLSATDPDGCNTNTPLGNSSCSAQATSRVQPASRPCSDPAQGGSIAYNYTSDGSVNTTTQSFVPAVVGENRVCIDVGPAYFGGTAATFEATFFASAVYPASDNRNCTDYSTQQAAQLDFNQYRPEDPYRLDADNDGIACDTNRCPCYSGTGLEVPAPTPVITPTPTVTPAATVKPKPRPNPSCQNPSGVQTVSFSRKRYPAILRHYKLALKHGWPKTLVLNRSGADARRDKLLSHFKTKKRKDRDEYPPATARGKGSGLRKGKHPRGWKADVAYVPRKQNRSHGASLGNQLRTYCNGTRFSYAWR